MCVKKSKFILGKQAERDRKHVGHVTGHKNCPACKQTNVLLLQIDSDFSRLSFSQAATLWMDLRKNGHFKPRTHETNDGYIATLNRFFGAMRLCDITPGHIRAYQQARQNNTIDMGGETVHPWTHTAGHSIINHELSMLGQVLRHAKLWARIQPYYFPLAIPKWSPRDVLSEDDEEQLFRVAAEHPEAALAYWVACITNNTTAAGCELRGLRLKNIFLCDSKEISEIYIPDDAVKNDSRPRKISLNRTARWAVDQCYKRAIKLGCCEPDHYLFPFRINRKTWDPSRPASRQFLRKSWDKLRDATGFHQLTPHSLRHQCITRLLENGVNPETVRAIAGHVSPRMMEYYSHIRKQAKYEAVMAIELGQKRRRSSQSARRTA